MGTVCTCGGTRGQKTFPALFDDDVITQYIRMWWVTLALRMSKHMEEFNAALASKTIPQINNDEFYKKLNAELRGFLHDIYGRYDYEKSEGLSPKASQDLFYGFVADDRLLVNALCCFVEYVSLHRIFQDGRTMVDNGLLKVRHTIRNEVNSMCLSYQGNAGYYNTRAFQILDATNDGKIQRDTFFACLQIGSDRFKEFSEAFGFPLVDALTLNSGDPDMVLRAVSEPLVELPGSKPPRSMLSCLPKGCFQGVVHKHKGGTRKQSRTFASDAGVPENLAPQDPCGNENAPKDYVWLEEVVDLIATNKSRTITCDDIETGVTFVPLFCLLGACPNFVSPMQAVMFSQSIDQTVDFWWVKPQIANAVLLEPETLRRHTDGAHKNDAGRSKPFLQHVADLFTKGETMNGWQFGVHEIWEQGNTIPRAYLRKATAGSNMLYVTLMWQEDWTMNPLLTPFIKGKILYQKDFGAKSFWSRQYEIYNGIAYIADFEEGPKDVVMPDEDIKQLWELGFPTHA